MLFSFERISQVWWLMHVIPTLWEAEVGGSLEPRNLGPAWATWQNPFSSKKQKTKNKTHTHTHTKQGRVQWFMPVITVLWEAEVGRSPEVRSWTPAWPRW